ncbi:hypothetical protein ACHAP8_004325 [Fusarium lateritium]
MAGFPQPKRKAAGLVHRLLDRLLPADHYPSKHLNLAGKTALVTGTTSGLGLEACRQLLSHGVSQLIMSARTEMRGEAVASELRVQYPHADIQVWVLEMEAYDSVIAFAERAVVELDRLDMVILNAGTFESDASVSPYTGTEKMFQVNCLSTALLARLFVPVLQVVSPEGETPRLTIVTGRRYNPKWYKSKPTAHDEMYRADLLKKSNFFRRRSPVKRFLKTKMLLQPYLSALAAVVNPEEVTINLVTHLLVRDTQLADKMMRATWFRGSVKGMFALFGRTLEKGAASYIDAVAVKGRESHGRTILDCRMLDRCKETLGAKIYNAGPDKILHHRLSRRSHT